ncbi:dimethylamine monooxygenase subunit DmmA family protein [Rhodococcus globerulus]|uniref:Dimethylamine monooxygenase subunit DmmA family protein n=1 Tax=Rhodococcus globerulus TaxID=33008 RepID=A0ABU4C414_RHOGO|nr:dimethylamine monooxygenase subunit DmmA family protein [Rhodococcus globerulus]MDV6271235.1 dimethylamine monooxygenase subunit DmmA family protein [Rhodococcus globerulus]
MSLHLRMFPRVRSTLSNHKTDNTFHLDQGAMNTAVADTLPPRIPSVPHWPVTPPPPNPAAASYLIVAIGALESTARVVNQWISQAGETAPTQLLTLDSMESSTDRAALVRALDCAYTGVRILVTGGQYDVIVALTAARDHGAIACELTGFAVHTRDAPVYCAHCRNTFRAQAEPGELIMCAHCARTLEIHEHFTSALGSFLASDAHAREIV